MHKAIFQGTALSNFEEGHYVLKKKKKSFSYIFHGYILKLKYLQWLLNVQFSFKLPVEDPHDITYSIFLLIRRAVWIST